MKINEENLRLMFRNKLYIPLTKKKRRKNLLNEDFTIISNNCWGGTVYESYGLLKRTPTVGMFIMPDDYLKFISNLNLYFKQKLVFISPAESKWKCELEGKSNWGTYLIAMLGDIELHMLHYDNEAEANMKWEKRIKRINWNRLIVKFNDQNGCTREHLEKFFQSEYNNKICFVSSEKMKINEDVIIVKQPHKYKNQWIKASREPFGKSKYINITSYINKI